MTTELRLLSCDYCASATAPIATARQLLLRRCDWAAGHNDRTNRRSDSRSDCTARASSLRCRHCAASWAATEQRLRHGVFSFAVSLKVFVALYCYVDDFDCYVYIGVFVSSTASRQQQRLHGGLRQK